MQNISVCSTRRTPNGIAARGFTLIEIMVVVVIMGIMAALIVPKLMGRTDDARIIAAKQDIATVMQALKLYKLDNQRYPTTEQGLQALLPNRPPAPPPMAGKPAVISTSCRKIRGEIPISICPRASMVKSMCSLWARMASPGGTGNDADIGSWDL